MGVAKKAGSKLGGIGGKLVKMLFLGCGGLAAGSFVKNAVADGGDLGRAAQDTWDDLGNVARGLGVTASGVKDVMLGDGKGDKGIVGDTVELAGDVAGYATKNANWLVPTIVGGGVVLGGAHMLGFGGKGGFLDWAKKGALAGAGLVLASKVVLPRVTKGLSGMFGSGGAQRSSEIDSKSFEQGVGEAQDEVKAPDASKLEAAGSTPEAVDRQFGPEL